ncbi:MAG TPA: hypothetical protein DHW82_05990 [Spirochaetia bacterium]|nr:hypothetical protein [Spirochaetia bacterium]
METLTQLTIENVKEKIKENPKVFLVFYSAWIGLWQSYSKIIKEMEEEYTDFVFLTVNLSDQPDFQKEFPVTSVPTSFLYKNGNLILRKTGLIKKPELMDIIDRAGM